MSRRSFFAKRLPFFGNRAMLILCCVFFLLPFMLRGAREAIVGIKNDVADWLPESFEETKQLRFFREHFIGDQFVVVSWEGCNSRDNRFNLFLQKVRRESVAGDEALRKRLETMDPASTEYQLLSEELEARDWATDLGLHTTGTYYEDWGEYQEKWLLGKNNQWYFIRQDGSVFKWNGQNNLIDAGGRFIHRFLNGTNDAEGTFVKRFGSTIDNRFYTDPSLLFARFFTDVITGPDIFAQMAGADGTMIVGDYGKGEKEFFEAGIETHKRLTGVLFGPTPVPEFDWTLESFLDVLPEEELRQIDADRQVEFQAFVDELVDEDYEGDIANLRTSPPSHQLEHWYYLFKRLDVTPPPRQTCFVVTLNDPVLHELARVVGRPVLGKPRGRILELATGRCGIKAENLHVGGPPVDNVAIDEEGSITLFRLVSLSGFIGISLAWLSFRSIRVTIMLFFVGGVAAISSLAFVWFLGGTLDAVLMTMPSLVFVLGLSGAVHVVNYYRDACEERGEGRAADIAVKHGLFPCALAAFTTALGLISLCTSALTPINKFGFFSAIATLATVVLLFTYLPASLTIWPPGYGRKREEEDEPQKSQFSLTAYVERFWFRVGNWVMKNHAVVTVVGLIMMTVFAIGIARIETSVQLLKLFRSDAKILNDYRWMEENLGKLVPMELVINVDGDAQIRPEELPPPDLRTNADLLEADFKLSMLQRMELSDRVRRYVLQVFGDESAVEQRRVIGNVMSTDLTTPIAAVVGSQERSARSRIAVEEELQHNREALLNQDYLRVEEESLAELWRISLRLAALNNVDYGQFVGELKTVVEPCMAAYRYKNKILNEIHRIHGAEARNNGRIIVIGPAPSPRSDPGEPEPYIGLTEDGQVAQTAIFANTLHDLLENSGFRRKISPLTTRSFFWLDLDTFMDEPPKAAAMELLLQGADVVVLLEDHANHPYLDQELLDNAGSVILANDFRFEIDPDTKQPLHGMLTSADRKAEGDEESLVTTSYTGIVPIVYKAQRSLLRSLIESICLAFVMIALVMMILLRPWGTRLNFGNALNVRAGMVAMIPNIFPIVMIFGAMGHLGRLVDIGSMMTASVAMGVAVDDTIHFLNWFRQGIARGMDRNDSIRLAYKKVASAMTQTTLIGGLGLSAFAFSTFMPTQRFGVLMLILLVAALIGDLVLFPAILAGPLGKYFCNVAPKSGMSSERHEELEDQLHDDDENDEQEHAGETPLQTPHMISFKNKRGRSIPGSQGTS